MSFGAPPRRPSSLPRSHSLSGPSKGNPRLPSFPRSTEGEPSVARPYRALGRNNTPLPSRESLGETGVISLNSPEYPPRVVTDQERDVDSIEARMGGGAELFQGTENHSMGPVAELFRQFLRETDDGLSPSQKVSLLHGSLLQPADIQDRGVNSRRSVPRFVLANSRYFEVKGVVQEVQEIIDNLVLEMDTRISGFKIDPGGKLLEALRGTDTIPQLENAWLYITNRLFEGGKHINKYYREDRYETVDSPRSTESGFFDNHFHSSSVPDALRKHLSHPRQWASLGLPSRSSLDELPALDYLRPLNPILQAKFPDRSPESSPKTYTMPYRVKERRPLL